MILPPCPEPVPTRMFSSALLCFVVLAWAKLRPRQPGHGPPLWREGFWPLLRHKTLNLLPVSCIINFRCKLPVGEWKDTNLFQCTFVKDFQIPQGWGLFLAWRACWPPPELPENQPLPCRGTEVRFEKNEDLTSQGGLVERKRSAIAIASFSLLLLSVCRLSHNTMQVII